MPEQLPVQALHHRVRHARKNDELAVAAGELFEEILQIVDRRDAVVFAANQQHRRHYLFRIDQRQIRRHIQVRPGGDLIPELQFFIRQKIADGGDRWCLAYRA